jgi:hypothetical protein
VQGNFMRLSSITVFWLDKTKNKHFNYLNMQFS